MKLLSSVTKVILWSPVVSIIFLRDGSNRKEVQECGGYYTVTVSVFPRGPQFLTTQRWVFRYSCLIQPSDSSFRILILHYLNLFSFFVSCSLSYIHVSHSLSLCSFGQDDSGQHVEDPENWNPQLNDGDRHPGTFSILVQFFLFVYLIFNILSLLILFIFHLCCAV